MRLPRELRPIAGCAAVLLALLVLLPRAQGALDSGVPTPVHVALIVALAGAAGAASWRTTPFQRLAPAGWDRVFAGLVLADAAVVAGLAAYAGVLGTALAALAATAVGAVWPAAVDRARSAGRRGRDLGRAALAGAVLGLAAAPLLLAVTDFATTREWAPHLARTAPGMQAAVLVAAVVGLVGAVALGGSDGWSDAPAAPDAGRTERTETDDPGARATEEPNRRHPGALLEVTDLDVCYGRLQVLFGVDLTIGEGEAVALLGTNGAGKSTVLRAVFGLTAPTAGRIWFDGEDITGVPAERLAARGLAQVPGGHGVFPSLTVRENLTLAGYRHRAGDRRIAEGIDRALATFPRLVDRLDQPAGVLSGGEQQMLAISRAWIARPRLLAIDELTLGLDPTVVAALVDVVHDLQDHGIALLLVEQSVHVALELTERALFLERGQVRFDGPTADLAARDDLLRSVFLQGALEATP